MSERSTIELAAIEPPEPAAATAVPSRPSTRELLFPDGLDFGDFTEQPAANDISAPTDDLTQPSAPKLSVIPLRGETTAPPAPIESTSRRRGIGAFILAQLSERVQDDLVLAAEQIKYYQAASSEELQQLHPDVTHVRRRLIAHEVRSTIRSVIYHLAEEDLILASDIEHAVRNFFRPPKNPIVESFRKQIDEDNKAYRTEEILYRRTQRSLPQLPQIPQLQPAAIRAQLGEWADSAAIMLTAAVTGEQPAINLAGMAYAAMLSGQNQEPIPRKYPTLGTAIRKSKQAFGQSLPQAAMPRITMALPALHSGQTDVLPVVSEALQEQVVTSLAPGFSMPSLPLRLINQLRSRIGDAYAAFNAYGQTLSKGIFPAPADIYRRAHPPNALRVSYAAYHSPTRQIAQALPIKKQTHQPPGLRPSTRGSATVRPRTLDITGALASRPNYVRTKPWYRRFVYEDSYGRVNQQVLTGYGAEFEKRVHYWQITHVRSRLLDEGPIDSYRPLPYSDAWL